MTIDRQDILRIADLAHLRLDAEEVERYADDLGRILDHVGVLRALDNPGAPRDLPVPGQPASGVDAVPADVARLDLAPVSVPDALSSLPADFAPAFGEGFFLVPPPPGVIDGGSKE